MARRDHPSLHLQKHLQGAHKVDRAFVVTLGVLFLVVPSRYRLLEDGRVG
jgi:hypothetical protein